MTETWTTDDQGWPTQMNSTATPQSPDVVYDFDPDGGLEGIDDLVTPANDRTLTFDSWGDTDAATAGSTSVDYTLDAFGRTTSRVEGSTTLDLYYSGATGDLAQTVQGATTTSYAYTPGGPFATKTGSTTRVYLRDLHGDVVGTIAPSASSLTDTLWYSPYGERQVLGTSALTTLGYQGDWTDAATGTVDMLTRDYLSSLGRFTSRDVLAGDPANPPSLNQFVYVSGSPITYWDPLGLEQGAADDATYVDPTPETDPVPGGTGGSTSGTGDSTGDQNSEETPPPGREPIEVPPIYVDCFVHDPGNQRWGAPCGVKVQAEIWDCPADAIATLLGGIVFTRRCRSVGSAPFDFWTTPVDLDGSSDGGSGSGANRSLDDAIPRRSSPRVIGAR